MRNVMIFTLLASLWMACGNQSGKPGVGADGGAFKALNFVQSDLGKIEKIAGELQFGHKWTDANGNNLLVFTHEEVFTPWPDDEGMGDMVAIMRCYHFAGTDDNMKLLQLSETKSDDCSMPPFGLEYGFYEDAVSIADRDGNGYAEAIIMLYINCSSEINPRTHKLVVLENGASYTADGDQYLDLYPESGKRNFSANFGQLPEAVQAQAREIWEKLSPLNPGVPAANNQPSISADELRNLTFFGTEPFWSIQISNTKMVYITPHDNPLDLNYTLQGGTGSYTLSQVISAAANQAVEIGVTTGSKMGVINVTRRSCSDGMSDDTHPFAVQIAWNNGEEQDGCGRWK